MRFIVFLLAALCAGGALAAEATRELPAIFEHDRIHVAPTLDGERVELYTDTGGGWNALTPQALRRLRLAERTESMDGQTFVPFPHFDRDAWIPDAPLFAANRLAVSADLLGHDGFLGSRWFADRVWELDYPRARMRVLGPEARPVATTHAVKLAFQTNDTGQRTTHFARMPITVDGETFDVLLDTGATATLTETSAPLFDVAPGTNVGTSFIEHDVFARWHARHPDWKVIEKADRKGKDERRMIRVPAVTIASHTVGPVWFAEQPSGAFQRFMAQWMDQPTWGALGGSGLRYFRIVIDYPNAVAYFHRDFE